MKVLVINGAAPSSTAARTPPSARWRPSSTGRASTERHWAGGSPSPGAWAATTAPRPGSASSMTASTSWRRGSMSSTLPVVYFPGLLRRPLRPDPCFLDRLFYVTGSTWAGKPGAAVVSCRRGAPAAPADQLNKYFTISNMPVVVPQYWNQVHGNTPEEVRQDLEGLQTMRTWPEPGVDAPLSGGRRKERRPAPGLRFPGRATNFIR